VFSIDIAKVYVHDSEFESNCFRQATLAAPLQWRILGNRIYTRKRVWPVLPTTSSGPRVGCREVVVGTYTMISAVAIPCTNVWFQKALVQHADIVTTGIRFRRHV